MSAFQRALYTSQEREERRRAVTQKSGLGGFCTGPGKFPRPSEMWGAQMGKPSSQENRARG
jgi:hypothetical protein